MCSLFTIVGNFLSLILDIADLDLYFSNFAPNTCTYIDFLKLSRHRNFKKYLTLIGCNLLTIFFVYVFTRLDWLSLHGFFELFFFTFKRKGKSQNTHGGKTLPRDSLLTNRIAYAKSSNFAVSVLANQDSKILFQGDICL